MMSPRSIFRLVRALPLATAVACDQGADRLTGAAHDGLTAVAPPQLSVAATVLHVADVEQLYAAVNDPVNEGAAIVLAPGTYVLSATNAAGVARPNGGRLELQRDMSLYGVTNDRNAVVIDERELPASSVRFAFGAIVLPTAPIRMGRGTNAIEWLSVLGHASAVAGIATELAGMPSTRVRVAHVAIRGAVRGIDVRNVGTGMVRRAVRAEIVDGDFSRGVQGVRISNAANADYASIDVAMSGNRSYMNVVGCIIENNVTNSATISVRSNGDRFEDNGLGCELGGGFVGPGAANSNSVVLEAHGTSFSNGVLQHQRPDLHGVRRSAGRGRPLPILLHDLGQQRHGTAVGMQGIRKSERRFRGVRRMVRRRSPWHRRNEQPRDDRAPWREQTDRRRGDAECACRSDREQDRDGHPVTRRAAGARAGILRPSRRAGASTRGA
jgi:hypothetical protein